MADLQICLLGAFQVSWEFSPVPEPAWGHPLARRLLALVLVRRPDPVNLTEAARLLGGTEAEVAAARQAVAHLLRPEAGIVNEPDGSLCWHASTRCWIDLDAMQSHYRAGLAAIQRGEMMQAILALKEADSLYQGDLLEELQAPWLEAPRARLRQQYMEILDRLAEGCSVLARYQDAVGYCHKALTQDPLREEVYQRMMVYSYYLGDAAGAGEAYRACREALDGAGRTPSPATEALLQQLRQRRSPPAAPRPASAAAAADQERKQNPPT